MTDPLNEADRLSQADRRAIVEAKHTLRAAVLARRAARSGSGRSTANAARTRQVQQFIGATTGPDVTIACYLSVSDEPSTLELIAWLAVQETRILLPVLTGEGRDRPMWAHYGGPDDLVSGRYGVPEPTGERYESTVLETADLIVVPGLAGNEQGDRLGRGGGWYDRALGDSEAVRLLLLNDDEILPAIPVEPTDRSVDVIVTEERVVQAR
ncbi:MAG TPA: 5-formyltetrahydrofolate cyclo-ligase [Candidatus Avipropionibacterium avicola]|uniref:5-formyltetrahydrofolate cyclo-ligase n=1 Tax=Candidatus Avipropionibacterium avicola TaxID=2840701 RepID=A0A9D1GY51_9ACTN|nr:5-formyltetrahydrofolate cyclo-ligase [Candidatus Avipropionibacterium avicola]